MSFDKVFQDKKSNLRKKPQYDEAEGQQQKDESPPMHGLMALQDQVGNQAVQAMLAQRKGDGAFDVDKDTSKQINQERGGGQALDSGAQEKIGAATGQDFDQVNVHTSPEADTLSRQLGAKAFTTGNDIFFRQGAYDPHSGAGQELLAHELTHVVQQNSGAVKANSGAMTVNAPNDAYEQEADAVAQAVTSPGTEVQRATEEGSMIARQEVEEEEDILKGLAQMQVEEDELLQEKAAEEPEENVIEMQGEEELENMLLEEVVQTQVEEDCEGC